MAMKMFCDRCGVEINPRNSVIYARLSSVGYDTCNEYELCVSCAHELNQWLNGKKGENDE